MFTLEVEYLMGHAYGGSRDNRQSPEWPPHPARLHSAAVAAYHHAAPGEDVR
jgi:CRISPR-associated protein Csb2